MNIGRHQLILALATLISISVLGVYGTLSGDAVAGMIGALVAFITGGQVAIAANNGTDKEKSSE